MGAEECRLHTDLRGCEEPVTERKQKLWFLSGWHWVIEAKTLRASKGNVVLPGDRQDILNESQEEVLVREGWMGQG